MNLDNLENNMNQGNDKNIKKPFYKNWWFIVIIIFSVIVVFSIFNSITKNNTNDNTVEVNWEDIQLGAYIPEITNGEINVGNNSSNYLALHIKKISLSDYNEYKKRCIEMGYTFDSEEVTNGYNAFNKDGYELNLHYYVSNKNLVYEYSIVLKKPDDLKEFEWSTTGISTILPKTSSTVGKILTDSSDAFKVKVGNTSFDEFKEYVKKCEEVGFIIDSKKEENLYQSKNADGYELEIKYLGANTIEISLKAPKSEENTIPKDEPEKEPEENEPTTEEPKQEEPKKESVYYSTNDKDSVKNGNTGVYAYRSNGGQYYNYYIIDFDEGYVYFFSEGNGSESCDKVKITSGDLNNTLIITYHDSASTWQEGLHFKYKRQPDHLIVEDHNHFEFDFYSTNLDDALKIRDKKHITNY